MKLFATFALLVLLAIARTAVIRSSTRGLILPDYHDFDDDLESHEKTTKVPIFSVEDDEDIGALDDDDTTTTTTVPSTTTRRWNQRFPTRNPDLIPSRRPFYTQSSTTSTTIPDLFDEDDTTTTTTPGYDGDFRYLKDLHKLTQKLLEEIKKIIRNITGYDFSKLLQRVNNNGYHNSNGYNNNAWNDNDD